MQGPGPWLNEMRGLVDGGWEGGCEGRHRVLCPFGSVLRGGVTSRQQIQRWGPRDLGRGFGDKADDKQTLPVPSH